MAVSLLKYISGGEIELSEGRSMHLKKPYTGQVRESLKGTKETCHEEQSKKLFFNDHTPTTTSES